jgi:plastocyanin
VKRRTRILVGVLALAAGGVLPAVAVSETTPTIEAVNSGVYGEYHEWKPAEVTVAEGGSVTFSNPSGLVAHGLAWTGPSGLPTPSCSSGVPVNSSGTSWQGQCTFAHPGTYTFRCTVHPSMTGAITVNPNGTTTTTTTTTPPPAGGGSGPPPSTTNPGSGSPSPSPPGSQPQQGPTVLLPAGSPLIAVTLPASQRGKSVHGSVEVSQTGVGGRLEVGLSAGSASVAGARRPAQVRVGRLVRSLLHAGTVSFAVPLSAKAKRALERRRRLALTVKVSLLPAHGSAVGVTRRVVLHS